MIEWGQGVFGDLRIICNILVKVIFELKDLNNFRVLSLTILQGLGVGPGSVTERCPFRKNARKSFFFRKKIKIT